MTIDAKSQTTPPRSEKLLSVAILSVLGLIAVGIIAVQSDYNPAVVLLYSEPAPNDRSASTLQVPAAVIPLPLGISALTAVETFESKTLSDKINGKAELYLSAGFKKLQSQRFGDEAASDRWFEIFVFDMATQDNAFAVYSSQQREDAISVDLGQYAYRTENAIFWIHGPYYLELIATDGSESAQSSMRRIAESFNRATTVEVTTVTEADLFPPQGLDRKSITLIPSDAFGLENFDRVLVADYTVAGALLSAFVSNRGSAETAEQMAKKYRQFLVTFGGIEVETKEMFAVEILDTYEIIFTQGPYIAGIHEAADLNQALLLARSLQTNLEDKIGR